MSLITSFVTHGDPSEDKAAQQICANDKKNSKRHQQQNNNNNAAAATTKHREVNGSGLGKPGGSVASRSAQTD